MAKPDQYSPEETQQRLRKIFKGAFGGPPTPLKAIPKKLGKSQPPRSAAKPKKRA